MGPLSLEADGTLASWNSDTGELLSREALSNLPHHAPAMWDAYCGCVNPRAATAFGTAGHHGGAVSLGRADGSGTATWHGEGAWLIEALDPSSGTTFASRDTQLGFFLLLHGLRRVTPGDET